MYKFFKLIRVLNSAGGTKNHYWIEQVAATVLKTIEAPLPISLQ